MADSIYTKGATSVTVNILIHDTTLIGTTMGGKTGLAFNTVGLTAYYVREGAASVAITLATQTTTGAWSSGGFVEIDATNMPGVYRFDVPNAALASGSNSALIVLKGAAGGAQEEFRIELVDSNPRDAMRGGMTALPNANAAAPGGLHILGTNATAVSYTAGMTISNTSGTALTLSSSGSNGHGCLFQGNGTGAGVRGAGGTNGAGASLSGGNTVGIGLQIASTNADALSIIANNGHGMVSTGNGTSKHGAIITGGTAGTSDGIKAIAGTGGVDIRGNITGSVDSVTNTVGSVIGGATAAGQTIINNNVVALGSPMQAYTQPSGFLAATFPGTIASPTNITAGTITTVTTVTNVSDKTGYALTSAYDFAKGTTTMAESYAANGVAPTPIQALYGIQQFLMDFSIASTAYTVKKLDNSTTAFVATLNNATTPTAIART